MEPVGAPLPFVPILLLPFIVVFFVVVFPLWGVALGVLGLALLVTRGIDAVIPAAKTSPPVHRAFRWVLTWGGIADRLRRPEQQPR